MLLRLGNIKTDDALQSRAKHDDGVVEDYVELLRADARFDFPEAVVFFDGESYWLADGYHRLSAYTIAQRCEMPVKVFEGTKRDALKYSLGANAVHGLQRSNDDKRKAVTTALKDEEWGRWSDHEIARLCAVSQPMVTKHRASLITVISDNAPSTTERIRKDKHGNTSKMNTGNIGKKKSGGKGKKPSAPPPEPEPEPEQDEEPDLFADPLAGIKAAYAALGDDEKQAFRAWLADESA